MKRCYYKCKLLRSEGGNYASLEACLLACLLEHGYVVVRLGEEEEEEEADFISSAESSVLHFHADVCHGDGTGSWRAGG